MVKKISLGIAILLIAGILLIWNQLGTIIHTALEDLGPGYLGAPVQVEDVDISLVNGTASIKNFRIGAPEGFTYSTWSILQPWLDEQHEAGQRVTVDDIAAVTKKKHSTIRARQWLRRIADAYPERWEVAEEWRTRGRGRRAHELKPVS